jgi:hypothetical protein
MNNQAVATSVAAAIAGIGGRNFATNLLAAGSASAAAVGNAVSSYGNFVAQPGTGFWY